MLVSAQIDGSGSVYCLTQFQVAESYVTIRVSRVGGFGIVHLVRHPK